MERRATVTLLSNTRCSVAFSYPGAPGERADKERRRIVGLLDDALAIDQKGSHFNPAVQQGMWDGRRHMFYKDGCTFPKGITARVKALLREAGYRVMRTRDERARRHQDGVNSPDEGHEGAVVELEIWPAMLAGVELRPDQLRVVAAALGEGGGVLHVATGGGKCLSPETLVLLHDGRRVRADAVKAGDLLLGPDGAPRTVLSTCEGEDRMYEVRSNRYGYRFRCNSVHVLTVYDEYSRGVIDVPLDEFLRWNSDRRRLARMVFSGPVAFAAQTDPVPVDPWLLGLWYADGRKDLSFVEITKPDREIEQALRGFAGQMGLELNAYFRTPTNPQWRLVKHGGGANELLKSLRAVYGDGCVLPARYLRGSLEERRAFLAGIIDGDGSSDGAGLEVTWKQRRWALQLAFLARSLGFRCRVRAKRVRLPGWVEARTYWRVSMVGDTRQLPLRLERKHAFSDLRTGFTVRQRGVGRYAGWTLDGDGRFLLGNFVVTHNTEIAAAIIKALNAGVGRRCLFLVHTKQLLKQARERIALRLGTIEEHIGVIGDGRFDPKHITVATVQSLCRVRGAAQKRVLAAYLKTIDVVMLDECHHSSAKTFFRLVQRIDAPWRYGLSGTPFGLADGKGLMVEAAFGPVVECVTNAELIGLGVNARPVIRMLEVATPKLDDGLDWQSVYKAGIVNNDARNEAIAREAAAFAKRGWPTLVLVRELAHGDQIAQILSGLHVPHAFVHGQMPTDEVERQKDRLTEGKIAVLIASPIFGEGVDIPMVRALIIADGGQSVANVLQKIGRGLRRKQGDNRLDAVDFADTTHRWLARHSQERLALYEAEGFEVETG